MALPSLRHFQSYGIYQISSDPVEALVGEAWINAVYTDKGWATADGSTLLAGVEDWRHATKERQQQEDDPEKHQDRDQSREASKAGSRNRIRQSRKKP